MSKKRWIILYECLFSMMAVISIAILFLDLTGKVILSNHPALVYTDTAILIIFAVDYFVRLAIAKDKKDFFRSNIPDLIAIIPFSSLFKAFRLAKLFRILKMTKALKLSRFARIIALLGKFGKSARNFLQTNGLVYMLGVTLALILLGAAGIYAFEKGSTVNSFADAIWWSLSPPPRWVMGIFPPLLESVG